MSKATSPRKNSDITPVALYQITKRLDQTKHLSIQGTVSFVLSTVSRIYPRERHHVVWRHRPVVGHHLVAAAVLPALDLVAVLVLHGPLERVHDLVQEQGGVALGGGRVKLWVKNFFGSAGLHFTRTVKLRGHVIIWYL